jgi:branched-chain amino acid transport system ATP-binding protein
VSDTLAIILLLVGIVLVSIWAVAVQDAFTRPAASWAAVGAARLPWLFAVGLLGFATGIFYLLGPKRRMLEQLRTQRAERTVVPRDALAGVEGRPGVPKPDPILVVDGVQRRFGGLKAVDVDHLEIQRGFITGLIGPNGAGKTTLFNLLTGFDTPDEGRWTFNGADMSGSVAHLMSERGMVRTFQLTKALSKMTVLDNMMLGGIDQRGEKFTNAFFPPVWNGQEAELRERAEGLLERFGMAHMTNEYAGTLSGGQRKLLEMARALMTEPQLVMLDEPMAGVNPALTQSLLGHVKALRDEGMSVIFVEHDMDVVRDISDWVVVMAEGSIIAEGTHDDVTGDPAVIDAYLGTDHGEAASEDPTVQAHAVADIAAEREEAVEGGIIEEGEGGRVD